LITPWIYPLCKKENIPIVHTCYDFRLSCPIATHFHKGQLCHRCESGKEYWALFKNCRNNRAESLAYALRSGIHNQYALMRKHIDQFIVLSEFSQQWLISTIGIDSAKIVINPCVIPLAEKPVTEPNKGEYIAFAGRFVAEKGVELLIEAANRTGYPLKLAMTAEHPAIKETDLIRCVITKNKADLTRFYRQARFIVVPSIWYETFGIVAAEAMSQGIPVIASNIGALQNMVDDGVNGLLFEPRNIEDLCHKIEILWNDPLLCQQLAKQAHYKVAKEFNAKGHISRLLATYEKSIKSNE
jgi:glycosyltransferase involved in cell wall biosynthesis